MRPAGFGGRARGRYYAVRLRALSACGLHNAAVRTVFRQAAAHKHRAGILPRYNNMVDDRKTKLTCDLHDAVGVRRSASDGSASPEG